MKILNWLFGKEHGSSKTETETLTQNTLDLIKNVEMSHRIHKEELPSYPISGPGLSGFIKKRRDAFAQYGNNIYITSEIFGDNLPKSPNTNDPPNYKEYRFIDNTLGIDSEVLIIGDKEYLIEEVALEQEYYDNLPKEE